MSEVAIDRREFVGVERPALSVMEGRLRALGYTPCGSWENEECVYVFSAESHGPSTYGAARATLHWFEGNDGAGWYTERVG